MQPYHVVILGGGITGLTTAYRLTQLQAETNLSIQITVCEKDARFGGNIHTERSDDYNLELGPDSIYTRKSGGVELIQELGLQDEVIPVTPSTGTLIWHNQHLQPLPAGFSIGVPSDLDAFVKTELLTLGGKRRALEDLLLPFEDFGGDTSLGEFMRSRLGDEVVDVITSPLLAGIHAGDINRMSLNATMPLLRTLVREHHSLILGAMSLAKRSVTKKNPEPAQPIFINLRHGLEQLVDTLVEKLQEANLQLRTSARKVHREPTGKYTVTVETETGQRKLEADAVVVATPAFVAARLLSETTFDTRRLESLRSASTATVSFGYEQSPLPTGFTSSGFLVPRNEGVRITAATIVSNKWRHAAKSGKTLIRCYVGRDGDEEAVFWGDEPLLNAVEHDLQNSLRITTKPDFVKIKRWYQSMPQYDVGHLELMNDLERSLASFPGLILAGAAFRGVGIPDCISDATRAAQRITEFLATI